MFEFTKKGPEVFQEPPPPSPPKQKKSRLILGQGVETNNLTKNYKTKHTYIRSGRRKKHSYSYHFLMVLSLDKVLLIYTQYLFKKKELVLDNINLLLLINNEKNRRI